MTYVYNRAWGLFPNTSISPTQLVQRPDALLIPFRLRDPELLLVHHDIRQYSAAEEDHVLSPRRIFDTDFEVLRESRCQHPP